MNKAAGGELMSWCGDSSLSKDCGQNLFSSSGKQIEVADPCERWTDAACDGTGLHHHLFSGQPRGSSDIVTHI
jgi:hypothetical protein